MNSFSKDKLSGSSSNTVKKETPPKGNMVFLRSSLFYLFFILSIPPTAIAMGVLALTKTSIPWLLFRWWGSLNNLALSKLCGVKIVINHLDKVPKEEPLLFISNHTGPWETLFIQPFIEKLNITYVLKEQLTSWKYSFLALGTNSLKGIPVSRMSNQGDFPKMVDYTKDRVKQGISIFLFPQGTRCDVNESVNMGMGGILLAKKVKCPIQTMFVDSECWSRGRLIKDFGLIYPGTIQVSFGPFYSIENVKEMKTKVIHQQMIDFFKEELPPLIGKSSSPIPE